MSPGRRGERGASLAADALAGYSQGIVLDKGEGKKKLAVVEKCGPGSCMPVSLLWRV